MGASHSSTLELRALPPTHVPPWRCNWLRAGLTPQLTQVGIAGGFHNGSLVGRSLGWRGNWLRAEPHPRLTQGGTAGFFHMVP
jgi:hypothetical protein